MTRDKVIFWVTTGLIFLFQGVLEVMFAATGMAQAGIRALGYPDYFAVMLVAFKVLGVLALVIPAVPARVKEWAYAGFGIDFIAAFVSIIAVYGVRGEAVLPVVFMGLLVGSYWSYHRLRTKGAGPSKG